MTLNQEIQFWKAEAQSATKRELMMFAFGVAAGLDFARRDHATEIAKHTTAHERGEEG